MKNLSLFFLVSSILLTGACVSNPAEQDRLRPRVEQAPAPEPGSSINTTQSSATPKPAAKTIIPDITEKGRRGDIARMMLKKSSNQFLKADTDRNYQISKDEAKQHLPHMSRSFSRYDKNSDEQIDWQEYLGHSEWPRPSHE